MKLLIWIDLLAVPIRSHYWPHFLLESKCDIAGPHPSHRTTSIRSTTTMTTSTATTTSPTVPQGLRPRGRPPGLPLEARRGRPRGPRREVRPGALLRISKRISGIVLAALVTGHLHGIIARADATTRSNIFGVKRHSFLRVNKSLKTAPFQ